MEQIPTNVRLCPSSASIAILRGHFMSTCYENVIIIYSDRIETYILDKTDLHFVNSQHLHSEILMASMLQLPNNYLRNYMNQCTEEPDSVADIDGLQYKGKSRSTMSAAVLVCRDNTAHIAVFTSNNTQHPWEDIARYTLESAGETENGNARERQDIFQKLLIDEKSSCMMILESRRWLHIMPISVKQNPEVQKNCVVPKAAVSRCNASDDVDSWAAILEMDANETESPENESEDISVGGESKNSPNERAPNVTFFVSKPIPLIVEASEPYYCIDLHSLSSPICSVIDCIPLIGYTDPCFAFLHQPHLTWSGRMKLRSPSRDNDLDLRTENEKLQQGEVSSENTQFAMSIDEGKRMLSTTLSILSFDVHGSGKVCTRKQRSSLTKVIWSLDNFPYNCTNMFLMHDSFKPPDTSSDKYEASTPLHYGNGILIFSVNCVFYLSFAGHRKCFACYLNRHGEDELTSEKNQFVLCPTLLAKQKQTAERNTADMQLNYCTAYLLSPSRTILFDICGKPICFDIHFASDSANMVESFSLMYVPFLEESCQSIASGPAFPPLSGILPLSYQKEGERFCSVQNWNFLISSTAGDVVFTEISEISGKIMISKAESVTNGLCPIKDIDVFSHEADVKLSQRTQRLSADIDRELLDSRLGNMSFAITGGEGAAASHLSFIQPFIRPKICSRFSLEGGSPCSYIQTVNIMEPLCKDEGIQSLVFVSCAQKSRILLFTAENVYDVAHERAHTTKDDCALKMLQDAFSTFSHDQTVHVSNLCTKTPTSANNIDSLILHITSTNIFVYMRDSHSWNRQLEWSVFQCVKERSVRITKAIVLHDIHSETQEVHIAIVLHLSDLTIITTSLTLSIDTLQIVLQQPHLFNEIPASYIADKETLTQDVSLPTCISRLCGPYIVGMYERNSRYVLWKIERSEQSKFTLKLLKLPTHLRTAYRILESKSVVELSFQSNLVIARTCEPNAIHLFQAVAARVNASMIEGEEIPHVSYVRSVAIDAGECFTERLLWPLLLDQNMSASPERGGTIKAIYVAAQKPLWVVLSPTTNQPYIHMQQVAHYPYKVRSICTFGTFSESRHSNAPKAHYFIAINSTTIEIICLSALYSYDAALPTQKMIYNKINCERGLSNRNALTEPLRVVYTQCKATQNNRTHRVSRASLSNRAFECFCVLQRNTERWPVANLNEGCTRSFHPPLTAISYSIAVFCLTSSGTVICSDRKDFSMKENVLDLKLVKLTVRISTTEIQPECNEKKHISGDFLAIGTSFPTNEEHHCTGCLYLCTIENEPQNNEAKRPRLCTVEKYSQQGPVTAVCSLNNGLLMCTVGSKIMVFAVERKQRRRPSAGHLVDGASNEVPSCFPYTHFTHELVLLNFFYSHSSIFISDITPFGRYVALSDLLGAINMYRIECYRSPQKESSGPAFSKPFEQRSESDVPDQVSLVDPPSQDIGTCTAVRIAYFTEKDGVTASSFMFNSEAKDFEETVNGTLHLCVGNALGKITMLRYPEDVIDEDGTKYKRENGIRSLDAYCHAGVCGKVLAMKRITLPKRGFQSKEIDSLFSTSDSTAVIAVTSSGQVNLLTPSFASDLTQIENDGEMKESTQSHVLPSESVWHGDSMNKSSTKILCDLISIVSSDGQKGKIVS